MPFDGLHIGHYILLRSIGSGGMGEVYLAEDPRIHRRVAIKVVRTEAGAYPRDDSTKDAQRLFLREAKAIARLDHPHILPLFDYGEENVNGTMLTYLVMPFRPEGSLTRWLEQRNSELLSLADVVQIVWQAASALQYAHDQQIIHQDVKPSNFLMRANNERPHLPDVVLADFGVARLSSATSSVSHSIRGTPTYMAPEQWSGDPVPATDQYALAVMTYELLTGRLPFQGPPMRMMYLHTNTPPQPPSASNPSLPKEVDTVLLTALAKKPEERFVSIAAFARALEQAAQYSDASTVVATPNIASTREVCATLAISKREAQSGTTRTLNLAGGQQVMVAVPAGAYDGQIIRLKDASVGTLILTLSVKETEPTFLPSTPSQSYDKTIPSSNPGIPAEYVPPAPSPPPAIYPAPPALRQRKGGKGWVAGSLLLLFVVVLIAAAIFVGPYLLSQRSPGTSGATAPPSGNPIRVTQVNGESIGISDGSFVFDTNRKDGTLKVQAGERFRQGDKAAAVSLWNTAVAQDTNDAEALIYLEDQRVVNLPHITLVVATALSGDSDTVGVGRDDLQGAYIAQKELNDGAKLPGGIKVRLLIASAGSQDSYATQVTQQIVQLAQSDTTFEGVMGWPYSTYSYNAIQILNRAHIPMVSQTASRDSLTGISPYFFRVAPTNQSQGIAGAKYAEQTLHARNIALFVDNTDLYSQNLAQDFSQQFTVDGGTIVATEAYTIGKPATLAGTLQDAVSHHPDLIYFSGYANDVGVVLTDLLSLGAPTSLQVLGGDALYDLAGYPSSARPALDRLHFTSFFYPDEWAVQGLDSSPKKPAFFVEYPAAFDPHHQHQGGAYGYARPTNDAALSYDALLALLKAYTLVVTAGKTTVTPQDIQQGLTQIHDANAVQGVSGQISFDATGNAVEKAVVILYFDAEAHIHMEPRVQGKFLVG